MQVTTQRSRSNNWHNFNTVKALSYLSLSRQ